MIKKQLAYRFYAWTLFLLFTGGMSANVLHVHFTDCTHHHHISKPSKEAHFYHRHHQYHHHHGGHHHAKHHHKDVDGSRVLTNIDSPPASDDCHWGDFTALQVDVAGFGISLYDLPSYSSIQLSYYKSILLSQGKDVYFLRGPPHTS